MLCTHSCALLVQLYLRIDRIDLAQKQLRQMQQADEDAALSQLANAWVAMALVRAITMATFVRPILTFSIRMCVRINFRSSPGGRQIPGGGVYS